MKSKVEYWQELIKQYEASRQSQEEFCIEKGIPLAKFKYRRRRQMEHKSIRQLVQSAKSPSLSRFEEISIIEAGTSPALLNKTSGINIQFPNQIRCELEMSISSPEFSVLLKHLVALC